MEKRDWQGEAARRGRTSDEDLEQLMRSILKLFADGCLVYRTRERSTPSVATKSDRLRRVRRHVDAALDVAQDGAAAPQVA